MSIIGMIKNMDCQELQKVAIQSALNQQASRYKEIQEWKQQGFEKAFEQMSKIFPTLEKSDNYTFLLCGDRFTFRRTGFVFLTGKETYCLETMIGVGYGYPMSVYDLSSYGEFLLAKQAVKHV